MSQPAAVNRYRIGPNDCITLDGVAYRMRATLSNGYVLARVDDPNVTQEFTHERIQDLMLLPSYRFEKNAFDVGVIRARHEGGADLLADIPAAEHETVLWRLHWCRNFLGKEQAGQVIVGDTSIKVSRSDRSMKAVIPLIHAEVKAEIEMRARKRNADGVPIPQKAGDLPPPVPLPPSPRSLRTWLSRLEAAGMRAVALRKRWRLCGDRVTQRYTLDERLIMAEFATLYASETRPTIRDVHKALKAEIEARNRDRTEKGLPPMRTPSYERFVQEIRSLPEFDVYAGRFGLLAAMKRFAIVANGPDIERPLQRVEIDEWRVDLLTLCRDAGILAKLTDKLQADVAALRPWLCVAMDAATRVILGMKMGWSTSSELALETLEMVVSPKKPFAEAAGAWSPWDHCGSPETVAHDQGASFLSVMFRQAVVDLQAEPDAPPAGLAHLRGRLERVLKTTGMQALAPYTGRTFESVVAKGDYNPKERLSLEVEELCRVLIRWVVDIYHNSPHAGLGGQTPANAWKELVAKYDVIPPPDRHVRRAIFGIGLARVLSSKGVRVLGLFFNGLELQEFRRRHGDVTVDVKFDPLDLGHVSVRLGDAGWLPVPCMRSGFDDVPSDIWLSASADLRRRFAAEARLNDEVIAAAIRDAWELAAQAQARTGILSTRPSRKQLDHAEEKLGIGFPAPETQAAAAAKPLGADLTERAIPTGTATQAQPAHPTAPKRNRTVKFED